MLETKPNRNHKVESQENTALPTYSKFVECLENYLNKHEKLYVQDIPEVLADYEFSDYQLRAYRRKASEIGLIVSGQDGYQGKWFIHKSISGNAPNPKTKRTRKNNSNETPTKLISYIQTHGYITLTTLQEQFEIKNSASARRLVNRLVNKGVLTTEPWVTDHRVKTYKFSDQFKAHQQKNHNQTHNNKPVISSTTGNHSEIIESLVTRYDEILKLVEAKQSKIQTLETQLAEITKSAKSWEETQKTQRDNQLPENLRNRLSQLIERDKALTGTKSTLSSHLRSVKV